MVKIDVAERTTASPPYRHDFRVSETNDFDRRNVFRTGFQGLFIFEGAATESIPPVQGIFFRTYTSVFEKVNKTSLMFTPITSR